MTKDQESGGAPLEQLPDEALCRLIREQDRPAEEVLAEAENSERSGYENNTQTNTRAVAGTGSAAVALRLCTEDANRA